MFAERCPDTECMVKEYVTESWKHHPHTMAIQMSPQGLLANVRWYIQAGIIALGALYMHDNTGLDKECMTESIPLNLWCIY